jgi:hypothetical protein
MGAIMTYLALAWLAGLSAGRPRRRLDPGRFWSRGLRGELWALVYLYIRLCRRFPIAGWIGLGFLAGVFGWQRPVYIRNEVTVDDEGNEVAAVTDDTYCDSGASSDSRED